MADETKYSLVAHLEERRYDHAIPIAAVLAIILGLAAMVALILFETSAIRLAADGAIWTGWNVLCGIGILSRRPVNYMVFRPK